MFDGNARLQHAVGGEVFERDLMRVAEGERQHRRVLHAAEEGGLDVPPHQRQVRPPARSACPRLPSVHQPKDAVVPAVSKDARSSDMHAGGAV